MGNRSVMSVGLGKLFPRSDKDLAVRHYTTAVAWNKTAFHRAQAVCIDTVVFWTESSIQRVARRTEPAWGGTVDACGLARGAPFF